MRDMEQEKCGFVHSCIRIRSVLFSETLGNLWLKVEYADHELQYIRYEDVVYSQMDRALGKRILMIEGISPRQFLVPRQDVSSGYLKMKRDGITVGELKQYEENGYKTYVHYAGENEEYIVIASGYSILDSSDVL